MWRDVAGLASTQVQIESISDHHVQICDIHLFPQMVDVFKPNLVVINGLHDRGRNHLVDTVRRRGGLCAVLASEGRPNTVEQLDWTARQWPAELCDLYLSWSEWFDKELQSRVPSAVTGCPRFDHYFRPFNRAKTISEWGLDPDKPIVTVASSFPQAKFADSGGDFLVQDWKNLGVSQMDMFKDPRAVAKLEKTALERFSVWISALHSENPGIQIVLKPHPAENIQFWQELSESIHIVLSDYIQTMLSISDVHVARVGCLTVPEAWLFNKRVVQCRMGNEVVDGASAAAFDLGYQVSDLQDFLLETSAGLSLGDYDSDSMSDDIQEYGRKYLGPIPDSSKRVAKALVKLLEEKNPKLAFDFTHADNIAVRQLLVRHDIEHATPKFDHINQFSKDVILTRIEEALQKERNWNEQENRQVVC
jgi:surface carbohydrate biosynthesis protein